MTARIVPFSEIAGCPDGRLDPAHYLPRHRVEDHRRRRRGRPNNVMVYLSEDLEARIDAARGSMPRSEWLRRAAEKALGETGIPPKV